MSILDNINIQELCNYSKDILTKYYDIDKLNNYKFSLNNNILTIKNINDKFYFDKKINVNIISKKNNKKYKKNLNNKNNPKLLKILSLYYDLNEISFEYSNNVCVVKNNNIKEYIYCDFSLVGKYEYYKKIYGGIETYYNLAILIQIGKWSTFTKMLHYIDIISNIESNFYITIIEEEAIEENINILKSKLKNCVILIVKNKGMDIGPFLMNLLYLRENNIKPKIILKIHTKTDDRFREHVLNHLIGSENIILNNILKLENKKDLGMLTGTLIFNTKNNNSFFDNHMYYLNYLSKMLLLDNIEKNKLEFAIGTFFYSKYEIFNVFDEVNLKFIYDKLNDINTIDLNWYSIFYNLNTLDKKIIEDHYEKNKEKNYKNNLDFQNKTNCSGMRDFMIEHALERFFGYLCKKLDYNMIEV